MRRVLLGATVLAFAACALPDEASPPQVGDPARDYAAATLAGDTVSLSGSDFSRFTAS